MILCERLEIWVAILDVPLIFLIYRINLKWELSMNHAGDCRLRKPKQNHKRMMMMTFDNISLNAFLLDLAYI